MTADQADNQAVEALMSDAQVFASAWALVGGPFDEGECLSEAEARKDDLRAAIAAALAAERDRALEDAEKALRERSDTHALVGNEVRMSEAFSCSLTVRALKAKETPHD